MQIQKLHIYSPHLQAQQDFYKETLNLPVREISPKQIEVQVGYSTLIVEEEKNAKPYHIAFHISAKKERLALKWLKKRVSILKLGKDDIVDFNSWDAMSIYFYDKDKNILEFISRRQLYKTETKGFSSSDIHGIAEIGLAVENVREAYKTLHQKAELEQFDGDLNKFCPIGDDGGLLITVDQNQKTWFPTKDKSENARFTLNFKHKKIVRRIIYDGKNLEVKS